MVKDEDKAARFQALLAERQKAARPKHEKWSVIESSLGAIYAAEDRGLSWQAISETLAEIGINVHRETLRLYVKRIPRDFDQYPKTIGAPMKRATVKKRAKQGGGKKSNHARRQGRLQGSQQGPGENGNQAAKARAISTEPSVVPSTEPSPAAQDWGDPNRY